ncbi:hypothetical protein [Hymenobacter wooponensis]|uniref:hypothetical protein n=1 Tax=Hymenobacter wooponensis TaxID=1525360 RepID=UPI001AEC6A98|nr:hypothetical protein [Hymenobacter wooponensis]
MVLLPGTASLIWLAVATEKPFFLKVLVGLWGVVFGLIALAWLIHLFTPKSELEKEDYYGQYVIDRSKFPGRQADWQYNHFRFEITSDDRITFHQTNGSTVIKTYLGEISTVKPYSSHRLVVRMKQPTHHILASNPTVYRQKGHFYLVFESRHFGSVFFIKNDWVPLQH